MTVGYLKAILYDIDAKVIDVEEAYNLFSECFEESPDKRAVIINIEGGN